MDSATEVTLGTAARILGLSVVEVDELCDKGMLKARRIGERQWWRIEYDSILTLHHLLDAARKGR